VCYLLGAQGLIGFVKIPYLYNEDIVPEEMYAVRLDRATGVVSEKTNRDYQIIARDADFTGVLEIAISDTLKGWQLGKTRKIDKQLGIGANDAWLTKGDWNTERIIKELIVERLKNIAYVGGFKSKGCGRVKLTVTEIPPE